MKDEQNRPLALGLLSGMRVYSSADWYSYCFSSLPRFVSPGRFMLPVLSKQGRLPVQVARRQRGLFPVFPRQSEKQTQPLTGEAGLKM